MNRKEFIQRICAAIPVIAITSSILKGETVKPESYPDYKSNMLEYRKLLSEQMSKAVWERPLWQNFTGYIGAIK